MLFDNVLNLAPGYAHPQVEGNVQLPTLGHVQVMRPPT